MMLLSITFGFSQTDSISVNTTQAERIIDKYTGRISEAFEEGLNKITPVAEQGFEIAVKLQIAKGITASIPIIMFIICFIWMLIAHKKHGVGQDDSFLSEITTIVFFIVSVFTVYTAITRLVAPEWFAIKEIIGLFNGS